MKLSIMINEMKNANFVISNGTTDNWDVPINTKYPLVHEYIDRTYQDYEKIVCKRETWASEVVGIQLLAMTMHPADRAVIREDILSGFTLYHHRRRGDTAHGRCAQQ